MAGVNDHAILDLGEDDFISTDYKNQFPVPDSPGSMKDTERLIDEDGASAGIFNSNFWTLAFYQQFFDVDTTTVRDRLIYSMVPVPGKSFLEHHIRPRPDLYGPFWICVTLVFSIAISGNMADFLQTSVDENASSNWHYDFHKVSLAATAVFSYAALLPAGLYGFLWWCGAGAGAVSLSFLELICLYGYSLAIYIPVSLLWLIQNIWWQWLCVLAGAGMSGAVLFIPIWPAVRNQAAKSAVVVMVVILGLHLLLACGFMLYFFHGPAVTPASKNVTEVVVPGEGPDLALLNNPVEQPGEKVEGGDGNAVEPVVQPGDQAADGDGQVVEGDVDDKSSEEKVEEKRSNESGKLVEETEANGVQNSDTGADEATDTEVNPNEQINNADPVVKSEVEDIQGDNSDSNIAEVEADKGAVLDQDTGINAGG